MSDTEPRAETVGKPRRRWGRLFGAAIVLCVLALFVALAVWAARPRWYTFFSKPTRQSPHHALVLRVPVGWQCEQIGGNDVPDKWVWLMLKRKPLSGFMRWWSERILRRPISEKKSEEDEIVLSRFDASSYTVADLSFESAMLMEQQRLRIRGYQTTVRTFQHALGRAHSYTAVRVRSAGLQRGAERYDVTDIVVGPLLKRPFESVEIRSSGTATEARRFQSAWNEIVKSIRVVQK